MKFTDNSAETLRFVQNARKSNRKQFFYYLAVTILGYVLVGSGLYIVFGLNGLIGGTLFIVGTAMISHGTSMTELLAEEFRALTPKHKEVPTKINQRTP
jgi:hypothetical protein